MICLLNFISILLKPHEDLIASFEIILISSFAVVSARKIEFIIGSFIIDL